MLEETTYISKEVGAFWRLDDLLSRISDERIKLQSALDVSYNCLQDQDFIIKKKDKLLEILHFQVKKLTYNIYFWLLIVRFFFRFNLDNFIE